MTVKIDEVVNFLRSSDGFLVLTHKRPDGDTIGSAAALCSALRRSGKTAYLFRNSDITEKYTDMASGFVAAENFVPACIIAVDVAEERMFPVGFCGSADLVIDHHGSNNGYGKLNIVLPDMSATGEIVLEIIEKLCGDLTREEADYLYIAVATDTGCFQYGNTNANTHFAAQKLIEAGADIADLNRLFFRTFSRARLVLEGYIFSSLRSYCDDRINIAVITLDMMEKAGAVENDCDDLASLPGKVLGNVISFTIRETVPGKSKISARSISPEYNVANICAKFGGGGHAMAAGCETDLSPADAADVFRAEAEAILK